MWWIKDSSRLPCVSYIVSHNTETNAYYVLSYLAVLSNGIHIAAFSSFFHVQYFYSFHLLHYVDKVGIDCSFMWGEFRPTPVGLVSFLCDIIVTFCMSVMKFLNLLLFFPEGGEAIRTHQFESSGSRWPDCAL